MGRDGRAARVACRWQLLAAAAGRAHSAFLCLGRWCWTAQLRLQGEPMGCCSSVLWAPALPSTMLKAPPTSTAAVQAALPENAARLPGGPDLALPGDLHAGGRGRSWLHCVGPCPTLECADMLSRAGRLFEGSRLLAARVCRRLPTCYIMHCIHPDVDSAACTPCVAAAVPRCQTAHAGWWRRTGCAPSSLAAISQTSEAIRTLPPTIERVVAHAHVPPPWRVTRAPWRMSAVFTPTAGRCQILTPCGFDADSCTLMTS